MSSTPPPAVTLAVLAGSLRRTSQTRRLAHALVDLAPAHVHGRLVEIGDLPLYNEDLETDTPPAPWRRFRAEIAAADAVLFVTPEYNRSVPAPLKNAVDVGSAPHGQNVFAGVPAGIVSASPGRMGAFGANHHLRQSLVFLDMPTLQQPELYLGDSFDALDETGRPAGPAVERRLTDYMAAFAQWIAVHPPVAA